MAAHARVHGAAEALEAIDVIAEATNPSLRTSMVVINRLRPDDREHALHVAELRKAHGDLVFGEAIPDCSAIPMAQRSVSPLHAWSAPGSADVADVLDDLLASLLPPPPPPRRSQPVFSLKRYL